MGNTLIITSALRHQLVNALQVAGRQYKADAITMRQVASQNGNPMITPDAAARLAEAFDQQEHDTRILVDVFADCEGAYTTYETKEDREEANESLESHYRFSEQG